MLDLPFGLHPAEERYGVVLLLVHVPVDVEFADVVQEVEVEVVHLAFLQLFREDLLVLAEVAEVVSGELGGEPVAVARVSGEGLAHDGLGGPHVVSPGGVEVVDARSVGLVHQGLGLGYVHLSVVSVDDRQAHGTETHHRKPFSLIVSVDHAIPFTLPRA